MYGKVMAIILLFPWSIVGVMLAGTISRRLKRAGVGSR